MIEPATYSSGRDSNRYRPAFPWRKLLLLVVAIALGIGAYKWRQKALADAVRAEMQATYNQRVAPVVARLREARGRSEQLALNDREDAANRVVAPGLAIATLQDKKVGYLRVTRPALRDAESLRAAADGQGYDAIGACLGVMVHPIKELTDLPDVLRPNWMTDAEHTNDVLRMEIRKEQLLRAIDRELPRLAKRLPVDYFMLVVVQGADRTKDPVDVYLWELESKKKLLQMRTEPIGRLISVRNQVGGSAASDAKDDPIVAADCSLAGQIKAVLGEPTESPE